MREKNVRMWYLCNLNLRKLQKMLIDDFKPGTQVQISFSSYARLFTKHFDHKSQTSTTELLSLFFSSNSFHQS